MAELTDEQKTDIVRMLAQFVSPAKIVEEYEALGIKTDRRQIGSYDPTRPYFEAGERWKTLFEATRKQFIEDVEAIPAANRAFRINLLAEAAMSARDKDKPGEMASFLRQIAEETGGVLTNRRELGVDPGALAPLSPEDKRAQLARLLDEMTETRPTAPTVETAQ